MANLYFEETEVGAVSTAGPYLVTQDEIIRFASQYDRKRCSAATFQMMGRSASLRFGLDR